METTTNLERALAVLTAVFGAVAVLPFTYRLLRSLYTYTLQPSTLSVYARPNAYALVTGASDGIGRGHARALAAAGFNLILHGRNESKLSTVRDALASKHPELKIRLLIIDASASHGMKQAIEAGVGGLADLDGPLTLLINNAGGVGPQADGFATLGALTAAEVDGMINLNARFHVQLTRALLPLLVAAQPAAIGTISSVCSKHPFPWLEVYSACKAMGEAWAMAMGRTFAAEGQDIKSYAWHVGQTCGTSHNESPESMFEPSGDMVAKACLARLGCGRLSIAPYWGHALQFWFMDLMPEGMVTSTLTSAMRKEIAAQDGKKGQ